VTRRPTCSRPTFAPLFSLWLARRLVVSLVVSLAAGLVASAPARGADDPVDAATKLYEKRRYEQAARLLEDALARLDAGRRGQAQLVLGMTYLRNADLHEALARTAATTELDYLDKLLKTRTEGRSRSKRQGLRRRLALLRALRRHVGRHDRHEPQ